MSLLGSSIIAVDSVKVQQMINEIISSINGKIGIHCCANTDWSIILNTNVDIISFDAYEYATNFLLYRKELTNFLKQGGIIAWGIIPTAPNQLAQETVETLGKKFENLIFQLEQFSGLSRKKILSQSLITPACGFGARDAKTTVDAFKLNKQVSTKIRDKYGFR